MFGFIASSPVTKALRWSFLPVQKQFKQQKAFYATRSTTRAHVSLTKDAPPVAKDSNTKAIDHILASGMGVVILKRGKARLFREGRNPIVFGGAVEKYIHPHQNNLQSGDCVAVCDGAYSCFAFGFFNQKSMFRVRILRHLSDADQQTELQLPWCYQDDIHRRLLDAVALRHTIGLCNPNNTVYRLVNGEGDRLSGLVVDRMGETLVISSSALWCERYKDDILHGLSQAVPDCKDTIWRPNIERLKQDGYEVNTEKNVEQDKDDDDGMVPSTEIIDDNSVLVHESGVKYLIPRFALTRGQKTGHYADQRENRVYLRDMLQRRADECRVLDLFCYTGGFAINAALGNERTKIVAVDSSGPAIAMARKNAELNEVEQQIEFIQSDVIKLLRNMPETEHESFDIVIVDPPKYAPNAKSIPRATHKYRSLNLTAMKMLKRGGLLITCTCSAAMSGDKSKFLEIVRCAAMQIGREVTMVKMFGAAADHPVTPELSETEYLTVCIFSCR